jgi:hypothetical protein
MILGHQDLTLGVTRRTTTPRCVEDQGSDKASKAIHVLCRASSRVLGEIARCGMSRPAALSKPFMQQILVLSYGFAG